MGGFGENRNWMVRKKIWNKYNLWLAVRLHIIIFDLHSIAGKTIKIACLSIKRQNSPFFQACISYDVIINEKELGKGKESKKIQAHTLNVTRFLTQMEWLLNNSWGEAKSDGSGVKVALLLLLLLSLSFNKWSALGRSLACILSIRLIECMSVSEGIQWEGVWYLIGYRKEQASPWLVVYYNARSRLGKDDLLWIWESQAAA